MSREGNQMIFSKEEQTIVSGDFSRNQRKNLKTSACCFQVATITIVVICNQTHLGCVPLG